MRAVSADSAHGCSVIARSAWPSGGPCTCPLCLLVRFPVTQVVTGSALHLLRAPAVQAYADYNDLMELTEEMVASLVHEVKGSHK